MRLMRVGELAKVGAPAGGKPERLSSSGKDACILQTALFITIKRTPAILHTKQHCFRPDRTVHPSCPLFYFSFLIPVQN